MSTTADARRVLAGSGGWPIRPPANRSSRRLFASGPRSGFCGCGIGLPIYIFYYLSKRAGIAYLTADDEALHRHRLARPSSR